MEDIVFKRFAARNGETITLRAPKWDDLDPALEFINNLVTEKLEDPGFGIITDQKQTRESEAKWLARRLVEVETGSTVHVSAFAGEKLVGQCEVRRGKTNDEFHHGFLGISVAKGYRDMGIGRAIMETALEECAKAGYKTVELEVFGNNQRAIHLYESVGFKRAGLIPKKMFREGKFFDGVVMATEL